MLKKNWGLVLVVCFLLPPPLQAQFHVLHSFAGASEGRSPAGSLILVGSTLYGLTPEGGSSDKGTIFKVNKDGTGFTVLHTFAGGASDGGHPSGSLLAVGSTLYGLTPDGGTADSGTVFKIETDGTGFKLLHSFSGGGGGDTPTGALVLGGATLYGLTTSGGANGFGAILKIRTDGTGFSILHSFRLQSEGGMPGYSLVLSGSTLYGLTSEGGSLAYGESPPYGTLFKIGIDGKNFKVLHVFMGNPDDGVHPDGSLLLSGSSLYGLTAIHTCCNNYSYATAFRIQTNGTGFTVLHKFSDEPLIQGADGGGSMIFDGSTLIGVLPADGDNQNGTVFKLKTDGSGFARLHAFAGGASDGQCPGESLLLVGRALFGMTSFGGASDEGTIFSLVLAKADIALSESVDNLEPAQFSEVNLTVSAKNNGPDTATGLKVTDRLQPAAGLRCTSWSTSQGAYDLRSGVWDVGTLAKDAVATLSLKVRPIIGGTVTNSAFVSYLNESDPLSANNQASVTINVVPALPGVKAAKQARQK